MKEIGELLKNSRTDIGVSIEEVANDLNYKSSQIEAIEKGDFKSFKDIFLLKCLITDYSKYLGLDSEKIIDDFNEYVFESTSKIPLDDIEKASKLKEKEDNQKIVSPYTLVEKKKNNALKILGMILILLIIAFVALFIYNKNNNVNNKDSNIKVSYAE